MDNDPLVLAHARALLVGTPEGRTDYLNADLRDVDTILAAAAKSLDLSQPVVLMLLGVVTFVEDDEESLRGASPPPRTSPPTSPEVLAHARDQCRWSMKAAARTDTS